jgi:hypothetical protein
MNHSGYHAGLESTFTTQILGMFVPALEALVTLI